MDERPPDACAARVMHGGIYRMLIDLGVRFDDGAPASVAAAIRAHLPMLNLREDAARLHPMGLRLSPARCTQTVYASAERVGGAYMTTLVLPALRLPETVAEASAGRRLSEVLEMPFLSAGLVVRRMVDQPSVGTTVVIEDDDHPVAPNDNPPARRGVARQSRS